MDINQLYQEIESLRIDQNTINIGDSEFYDDRLNLHHREDGKWEVFHGIRNEKRYLQIFSSEEQACDSFLKLIRRSLKNKERQSKPRRKYVRSSPRKIVRGMAIFCILFGMLFEGIQIYTQDFSFVFWFWIVWFILFGIVILCCKDDRTYSVLEKVAQPIAFGIFTLGCVAVMIYGLISLIPDIMRGDTSNIFTLVMIELSFGFFAFAFFNYYVKSYIVELIEKHKKKDAVENLNSTDDEDSE